MTRILIDNEFEIKMSKKLDYFRNVAIPCRVVLLPCIYLDYFESKLALTKIIKNIWEKYVLAVYFIRKDILRLANKLPRKTCLWGWQKNTVLRILFLRLRSVLLNVGMKIEGCLLITNFLGVWCKPKHTFRHIDFCTP